MPSFLDGLLGTVNTPSNAFNYGAAAAANRYPAAPGLPAGMGITPEQAALLIQQQRDDADRQYNLQKQQADTQYRSELMNARTAQDAQAATARYQNAQAQIARDRLQFDRDTQQQEFGLKQQQFGLQQAQLGYSVLGQAAQLRGPQNYFQASNFARGVNAQPGTSTFLSALQSNSRLPGFGAQAGSPDAVSLGNILGGGASSSAGTAGANDPNASLLAQIHAIGAAGAGKLGAGSLEQLSPTEMGLFTSGLEAPDEQGKAFDPATFLSQYQQSRIGQGAGTSRAA